MLALVPQRFTQTLVPLVPENEKLSETVRVPMTPSMVEDLDALVRPGVSRAALIREAVEKLLAERRARKPAKR